MADSSTETFPTSSDGTLDIGNIKVEEHIDIKDEEECIDIKDENCIYSEVIEEKEEEDIDAEEEDIDLKEEVS
jgi:hypothetical protein